MSSGALIVAHTSWTQSFTTPHNVALFKSWQANVGSMHWGGTSRFGLGKALTTNARRKRDIYSEV